MRPTRTSKIVGVDMLKAVYLTLGVLVARWVFRRHLDGDTLSRLRALGGV